jgi:hypothetical protein
MKSFSQTNPVHPEAQFVPKSVPQSDNKHSLPVGAPLEIDQIDCSATTVTEMGYREILITPTVWMWHGNLVIFGTNLVEKLKVEERPAQYDKSGMLIKAAEYVIDAQYSLGGQMGRATWHLVCDFVTTRSIFFFGEKGKDNLWFIPSANSRTRIFNNQAEQADKLVPAWVSVQEKSAIPQGQATQYSPDVAEGLYVGEAAATYAILLHMQGTNLPKATKLFEQLALDAQHQSPYVWPIPSESKETVEKPTATVNLKKEVPVNKATHGNRRLVRG